MTTSDTAAPARAEVKGGAVPYILVDGAAAAIDFYKKAFGAEEAARMPAQDGRRLMHGHIYVNGGSVMLNDFFPEFGHAVQKPAGFDIHLQVTGVDDWWKRALEAGCEIAMPLENQFWGDRYGKLRDPFGVTWSLGEPVA
ncbi:MAG: VOC family protein [Phenylobacterium sp.]